MFVMFKKFILIYTDIDLYVLPIYLCDVLLCVFNCLWTLAYICVNVLFHWYELENALCFL